VSSRYSEKVGAGATTRSPRSSVTARDAWISSLDPLPTRMPSAGQSKRAASSSSSWVGVNSGYRCHGTQAIRSAISRLSAGGTSYGLSFWFSLRRAAWALSE
jgi:hypothetical protein